MNASEGVVALRGKIRPASMLEPVLRVAEGVEGVSRVDRENLDSPDFTV